MAKILAFLKRISTPLKAIEYIVAFLVVGSAIIATIESVTDDPIIGATSSFRILVDQYNVLAYLLVFMGALAILDIISLVSHPPNRDKFRSVATFTFAIGFFFLGVLSVTTIGFNSLLWINDFALSAISATLYISIKAGTIDEHIY